MVSNGLKDFSAMMTGFHSRLATFLSFFDSLRSSRTVSLHVVLPFTNPILGQGISVGLFFRRKRLNLSFERIDIMVAKLSFEDHIFFGMRKLRV